MRPPPLLFFLLLGAFMARAAETTATAGPIGWVSVEAHGLETTTGGGDTPPVTVTTLEELKRILSDEAPRAVLVSGTIATGSRAIDIKSHKTLLGADREATIQGGLSIKGAQNIIVRNLNIQGAGVGNDPADAIAARDSHHLWFDHLAIWNSRDGNLDLTIGCDCITVSWCKFRYTDPANEHRLCSLVGGGSTHAETDRGKNLATYHHNWFAELADQRMPRFLFGTSHAFKNYYACPGNSYCIGVGSFAAVLIERNYFKEVREPHRFADGNRAHVTTRENVYDGTTGKQETGLNEGEGPEVPPFDSPPYPYAADPAAAVPELVMKGEVPSEVRLLLFIRSQTGQSNARMIIIV
jgi:pectate lyase